MLGPELWQTDPNGELFSCADDLRLVIRKSGGYARYMVFYRGTQDERQPEILLGSGTESDLSAAMTAARRAARRIGFILAERLTIRINQRHSP